MVEQYNKIYSPTANEHRITTEDKITHNKSIDYVGREIMHNIYMYWRWGCMQINQRRAVKTKECDFNCLYLSQSSQSLIQFFISLGDTRGFTPKSLSFLFFPFL